MKPGDRAHWTDLGERLAAADQVVFAQIADHLVELVESLEERKHVEDVLHEAVAKTRQGKPPVRGRRGAA